MIKNKRVLVTGMAGSIGSELTDQLARYNKVYGIDINETGIYHIITRQQERGRWVNGRVGDIRERRTVDDVFSDFKPQYIFHAAAYKHVTPMEWTPEEAIRTNIIGLYNVIHAAKRYESKKFVFISTDKAVQSNSIMGATKRVGEIMVKNQGKGFVAVRFGNVLGSRGSLIPIWEEQLSNNEDLTITDSRMERFMMTIQEACELVIKAADIGKGGEIMVMDMGKPVKILDLAKKIIKDSGKDVGIKEIGMRPGETLDEKIMFEEEQRVAKKIGRFYIIK